MHVILSMCWEEFHKMSMSVRIRWSPALIMKVWSSLSNKTYWLYLEAAHGHDK